MELKILSPTDFINVIEWNNEEIKAEMAAKVADYKAMVYGDDQIKDAKKDRAELNKLVKAMEDKRKEVKALCLAPYEKFEKQVKELVAIVNEPIEIIDSQVKAYEEQQKEKKRADIRAYYESKGSSIELERIYDNKWENATTSMSAVKAAIDARLDEINADLKILEAEPEYSFEAIDAYKKSLDIRLAMAEIQRLKDLAQRKAEHEALKKVQSVEKPAEVEIPKEEPKLSENVTDTVTEVDDNFTPDFESIGDNRHWLMIKAHVDTADHAELLAFLDEKKIEYTVL